MFFYCKRLDNFWKKVKQLLCIIVNIQDIYFETLVYGLPQNLQQERAANHTIAIAQYSIFKTWCQYKDKDCYKQIDPLSVFLKDFTCILEIEQNISPRNAKRKWGDLLCLLNTLQ